MQAYNRPMNSGRKNKGFTLIELLVVIAIIAVLTRLILPNLQDARKNAGNAAINQTVLQYLNAIELYHNATGSYPQLGNTTEYCLGDYKNIGTVDTYACGQYSTFPPRYQTNENSALATAFGQYMSGLPMVNKTDIFYAGSNRLGGTYACRNTSCSQIQIKWWLNGPEATCASGAVATPDGSQGNTYCLFQPN